VITFINEFDDDDEDDDDGDDDDDDEFIITIIVYIHRVHLNIIKLQEHKNNSA